ncbi:MAG: hypothetical protein ABIR39_06435 [Nocardioides sp.]|uniref:hypothetical protein n=1 Tax=Nocardioides sp. TaxID=35761 RepID=UPI0032653465
MPRGGFTLALEAVDGGINPDRSMLSLGLVETAPASGTTAQTPVEVSDVFEASQEVTKVGIRHVGVIEVVEPA